MLQRLPLALVLLAAVAPAQLTLARPFRDHMVLQRGRPVPVWGAAAAGERVTVSFRGQNVATTASPSGTWRVTLAATTAGGPFPLVARGRTSTVTVRDVMVGDVWLCSGQSNMVWPLRSTVNGAAAIRTSGQWGLRLWRPTTGWAVSSPATSPSFSAVAFYFGRDLAQRYKVPIGLMLAARGGTAISTWQVGAVNYRTYVAPAVGFALRGALWYQGESDARAGLASRYEDALRRLVTDWRRVWGQGTFPFFWVQIARYARGRSPYWMQVQEAQANALDLAKSGMACILDLPAPTIHPTLKLPVGQRLARIARVVEFGEGLVPMGPVLDPLRSRVQGSEVSLAFRHVGAGLRAAAGGLADFEIAGADLRYVPASARIQGSEVVVSASSVAHPVAVRYAWKPFPAATLFNADGLPASPFRFLATHAVVGKGCGGAFPPRLRAAGAPRLGRSFLLALSRLPPRARAALLLGASDRRWRGFSLPLDLGPYGAPGCALYQSADAALGIVPDANGVAGVRLAVPASASLLGKVLFEQGVAVDAAANALGIVATEGGASRVGY